MNQVLTNSKGHFLSFTLVVLNLGATFESPRELESHPMPRPHPGQLQPGFLEMGLGLSRFKTSLGPWLVWLSGLSAGLQTERSLVRFLVRAHAWVAGQVSRWGIVRGR